MKLSCFSTLSLSLASLALVAGDCYNSTTDMLTAQIGGEKEIVICPNTTINIGLPTDGTFSTFAGGDLPLTAVGDNVTIKCGEDGKSSNYCALSGGLIQFATQPALVQAPNLPPITTNNLKVQGLTFTGQLASIPGAGELSVILSTPGKGMVFEDCVFEDLVANTIFSMEASVLIPAEAFPPLSAEATIKDSVFRGITYSSVVLGVYNQTLNFENVSFEDMFYNPRSDEGIDMVIYGSGMGELTIMDSDFSNIEYKNSVVYVRGDMNYSVSGNTGSNWKAYDVVPVPENQVCTDGLIVALSQTGLDLSTDADSCLALTDTPVVNPPPEESQAPEGETPSGGDETTAPETEGGDPSMASTMAMNTAALLSGFVASVVTLGWL